MARACASVLLLSGRDSIRIREPKGKVQCSGEQVQPTLVAGRRELGIRPRASVLWLEVFTPTRLSFQRKLDAKRLFRLPQSQHALLKDSTAPNFHDAICGRTACDVNACSIWGVIARSEATVSDGGGR